MKKTYFLFFAALLFVICFHSAVNAQTVVFSDNFDRTTFATNTAYGTPACTYKITTGSTSTVTTQLVKWQ